jgi:hypothetical protein
VTESLLVTIDRGESPQLADDPFDALAVVLAYRLPPFRNELRGASKVGAFPDASRAVLELPFPC